MIEINDLTFSYRNRIALKDLNITIEKGDSVAIIGPNGSGKSTFLKLLNGLAFPSAGSYVFEGSEITEKAMKDSKFAKLFHKKVGFVFQNSDAQLFCPTVYDEIAFGPRQMGIDEKEVKVRVRDCLNMLHIEDLSDIAPYNLSGGEKKRVAIASVLSLNPDVLTLDEPTNSLDPKTKSFLRDLLIKLNSYGKTLICATHDFEYLEGVFKKIIVFSDEHCIVKHCDYNQVIKNEQFLRLHNIK